MDLPEFSGNGSGPQGTGGIPPEEILSGLKPTERDLALSSQHPEDGAAAQRVIGAEADSIMSQLGLTSPQAPTVDTPASATPAAPAPAQQIPQDAAQEAPMVDRVKQILQRYGDDKTKLAEGLLHAKAAATRAQQDRAGEISELRDQLVNVNAQLAALLTPRPASADTRDYMPGATTHTAPQTGPDFWTNPQAVIQQVVQESVQANLLAYDAAARQRDEQKRRDEKVATINQQHSEDVARLKPVMAKIFSENQAIYANADPAVAYEDLFKRAQEREQAELGRQLYREMSNLPPDTASNPAPSPGAAPVGAGSGRAQNTGAAPPVRDWSRTPEFERLWKSKGESAGEMGAITDVLRQRGFGEHIP